MALSGQILDNPISGERFTFRETAADIGGQLLVVDLELSPEVTYRGHMSIPCRRNVSK
jgi:hypothetical protein